MARPVMPIFGAAAPDVDGEGLGEAELAGASGWCSLAASPALSVWLAFDLAESPFTFGAT